jgi:hypothetical protein
VITRQVACTRGFLTAAVLWGLGSVVTVTVFRSVGAHTTIADVSGQSHRVQIIWWGSHAFCACIGGLLGVAIGGTALTGARLTRPLPGTLMLALPILAAGVVVLGALTRSGVMSADLAIASAAGLLTGVAGGAAYVLQSGVPDDVDSFYPAPRATGRSWGSR